MTEITSKNNAYQRRHVAAWIGLGAMLALWVAYIGLLAFMIWTANEAPDPGIDPKMAEDLMHGAANMVRVLIPAGFVLALITVPIMLALRRKKRPT